MAELMKSKLPQRLAILAILIGCLGFLTSATPAMAGYTGCGEPFVIEVTDCWPSYYIPIYCTTERYACVMCDQGSPCYYMYQ